MSGKSNILQVFRFLVHLVAPTPGVVGLANAVNAFGGFGELAWKGGDSNLISVELEGDLAGGEEGGREATWQYRIDILGNRQQPTFPVTVQDERLRLKIGRASCR